VGGIAASEQPGNVLAQLVGQRITEANGADGDRLAVRAAGPLGAVDAEASALLRVVGHGRPGLAGPAEKLWRTAERLRYTVDRLRNLLAKRLRPRPQPPRTLRASRRAHRA
jgi:hypothetical protein